MHDGNVSPLQSDAMVGRNRRGFKASPSLWPNQPRLILSMRLIKSGAPSSCRTRFHSLSESDA